MKIVLRVLAGLIALIVIGFGALMLTFTAARLDVPEVAVSELPPASPPDGMTISALPTGSMESKALFAFRGGSISDKRDFTMTAILVHHPNGDLLFDTGFGRNVDEHAKKIPWLMRQLAPYHKGNAVSDQLAANGYPPSNLTGVVLTHAHWDHVSGLDSLPGVRVWVSAAESNFIAARTSMTELINSFGEVNYRQYEFEGGPYLGFLASHDFWGDGSVVLVPASGHTPGSIGAFITLPSGTRYALLGDLVWQLEGIELPAERPWLSRRLVQEDDAKVRENISRVAAIHGRFPEIRLVPAHDARAFADIPVYPATGH